MAITPAIIVAYQGISSAVRRITAGRGCLEGKKKSRGVFVHGFIIMRRSPRKNGRGSLYFCSLPPYSIEARQAQPRRETFKEKTFNRTRSPGPAIKRVHPLRWKWNAATDRAVQARPAPRREKVSFRVPEIAITRKDTPRCSILYHREPLQVGERKISPGWAGPTRLNISPFSFQYL